MVAKNYCDIVTEYDQYFEGGEKSLYNTRFGKRKTTLREEILISRILKERINLAIRNQRKNIDILDFGCGDGRLFDLLYKSIAKQKYKNLNFKIVSYDTSRVGIMLFARNLYSANFSLTSNSFDSTAIFVKENVNVELVHGKSDKSFNENVSSYNYDIILCLFGVLDHVPERSKRLGLLNSFNNLLKANGYLALSIPTRRMFKKEHKEFERLRNICKTNKISNIEEILGHAKESGDLYYQVTNSEKTITNFYHLFALDELKKDLKQSNLSPDYTGVYCIQHISQIVNSRIHNIFDAIFSSLLSSKIFPSQIQEKLSKYIVLLARKESIID